MDKYNLNLCFHSPSPDYSLVFEDDGKAAYGYLRQGKSIVGDVWVYNRCLTPSRVPCLDVKRIGMPVPVPPEKSIRGKIGKRGWAVIEYASLVPPEKSIRGKIGKNGAAMGEFVSLGEPWNSATIAALVGVI